MLRYTQMYYGEKYETAVIFAPVPKDYSQMYYGGRYEINV